MIFNFILLLIWELNIELYILSESFWKVLLTQLIILLWTDYITALDVSHFFFFFFLLPVLGINNCLGSDAVCICSH